jgi:hypothetical protein
MRPACLLLKVSLKTFQRPVKGLFKALKRPLQLFERFFKGLSKAFKKAF